VLKFSSLLWIDRRNGWEQQEVESTLVDSHPSVEVLTYPYILERV
jgi:hypothetical protein